jgi:hypothetical protein
VQGSDFSSALLPNTSEVESDIASNMLRLAVVLQSTGRCGTEEVSPFCVEAMYRSGIYYARKFGITGEQSDLESLENIKIGLGVMNHRWKSAGMHFNTKQLIQESKSLLTLGVYVEMLEARSLTGIL